MADGITFEIKKDFGGFGDGRWQKHLTLISWNGRDPVYDLRTWNDNMTKCGKGLTLSKEDLYDLLGLLEDLMEADSE